MKPTAYLVNVARGRVVDEAALIEALATRRIAGAGMDVTTEELAGGEFATLTREQVLITPHTAGETRRYEDNVIAVLGDNLELLWRGERNCITKSSEAPPPTALPRWSWRSRLRDGA